jgi:hypothetical protein
MRGGNEGEEEGRPSCKMHTDENLIKSGLLQKMKDPAFMNTVATVAALPAVAEEAVATKAGGADGDGEAEYTVEEKVGVGALAVFSGAVLLAGFCTRRRDLGDHAAPTEDEMVADREMFVHIAKSLMMLSGAAASYVVGVKHAYGV